MNTCPAIFGSTQGIATALRAVDCLSARGTAVAFGRLFGADAALAVALNVVLTLYIALMAINLLTGRTRLGVATLTPRAFAIGMALTFSTSWVAYQQVVWNLAIGAPDQLAGIVAGTHGSATVAFADRLDAVFAAVSDAASAAQAAQTDSTPKSAGFSPADILWVGALLLLMGTVGVLLVARIALAALLAIGPVFIILSLFRGTRGLFEGWLKGLALFALVPLFSVLIGGAALAMLGPVVDSLDGGEIDQRAAVTVLLAAVVYCALMAIAVRVAMTVTSGWQLPGTSAAHEAEPSHWRAARGTVGASSAIGGPAAARATVENHDRVREILAGVPAAPVLPVDSPCVTDRARPVAVGAAMAVSSPTSLARPDDRARGLGSQFRSTSHFSVACLMERQS